MYSRRHRDASGCRLAKAAARRAQLRRPVSRTKANFGRNTVAVQRNLKR